MSTILSDYTLVSDSRRLPTLTRMGPGRPKVENRGRPKKEFKDTYRGKREAKKMAKMEVKLERERKKFTNLGTADVNILPFSQVGQKCEKQMACESNSKPEHKQEIESEPEFDFETEPEVHPESELKTIFKSKPYPASKPLTLPLKAQEKSFKKDFKDTYRGKRKAKKVARLKVKLERERNKFSEQETGVTPLVYLTTSSQVGQKYEKQIIHEAMPEPKSEPKYDFEFESETEEQPEPEPEPQYMSKPYLASKPVKITGSTRPELELSSLEADTELSCQDGSVTAPSLVLALLAPWLGQLLQPGRGQEDSIRIIICPDVQAASLRVFLEEVANMKEEIVVDEDVSCLFLLNLSHGLKETSTDLPEMEINNFTHIKSTPENSVELNKIVNKRETMGLVSRTKPKADMLSEVVKVKPTDNQKIEDFKVTSYEYDKCHKCNKLFMNIDSKIHVCNSRLKKVKKCTVCNKTSHKSNYHSTTPATCENCGKLFRNRSTLTKHSPRCIDEMPCPICGKLVKQMKQHTDFRHTPDIDKKWRCEHCGKGFLVERRMTIHMNGHLKLKPYKCRNGCDLGFTDTAHRGRHEKRLHNKNINIVVDKLEQ